MDNEQEAMIKTSTEQTKKLKVRRPPAGQQSSRGKSAKKNEEMTEVSEAATSSSSKCKSDKTSAPTAPTNDANSDSNDDFATKPIIRAAFAPHGKIFAKRAAKKAEPVPAVDAASDDEQPAAKPMLKRKEPAKKKIKKAEPSPAVDAASDDNAAASDNEQPDAKPSPKPKQPAKRKFKKGEAVPAVDAASDDNAAASDNEQPDAKPMPKTKEPAKKKPKKAEPSPAVDAASDDNAAASDNEQPDAKPSPKPKQPAKKKPKKAEPVLAVDAASDDKAAATDDEQPDAKPTPKTKEPAKKKTEKAEPLPAVDAASNDNTAAFNNEQPDAKPMPKTKEPAKKKPKKAEPSPAVDAASDDNAAASDNEQPDAKPSPKPKQPARKKPKKAEPVPAVDADDDDNAAASDKEQPDTKPTPKTKEPAKKKTEKAEPSPAVDAASDDNAAASDDEQPDAKPSQKSKDPAKKKPKKAAAVPAVDAASNDKAADSDDEQPAAKPSPQRKEPATKKFKKAEPISATDAATNDNAAASDNEQPDAKPTPKPKQPAKKKPKKAEPVPAVAGDDDDNAAASDNEQPDAKPTPKTKEPAKKKLKEAEPSPAVDAASDDNAAASDNEQPDAKPTPKPEEPANRKTRKAEPKAPSANLVDTAEAAGKNNDGAAKGATKAQAPTKKKAGKATKSVAGPYSELNAGSPIVPTQSFDDLQIPQRLAACASLAGAEATKTSFSVYDSGSRDPDSEAASLTLSLPLCMTNVSAQLLTFEIQISVEPRLLLRDADVSGLHVLFSPLSVDGQSVAVLFKEEATMQVEAFLHNHEDVSIASGPTSLTLDEALPMLGVALTMWLLHSLEESRVYVPARGHLLDVRATGRNEPGLKTMAAFTMSAEAESAAPESSNASLCVSGRLTLRMEGWQSRCNCVRGEFSPLSLLCSTARSELESKGKVSLNGARLWRIYADEESMQYRSTRVRLLPRLDEHRIIALSKTFPPPEAKATINFEIGSAADHLRWWGEHHGIWLREDEQMPWCTILREKCGSWVIVPAGVLWPHCGELRQARRADQIPFAEGLKPLGEFVEKHLQPLDDVMLDMTSLDGAFENLLSGEIVPTSVKAKWRNGSRSFQRVSTELQQRGESLAATEQLQSETVSQPGVVVHEPIRERSQKFASEANLVSPEASATVNGNSSSVEIPATPSTVPKQRRGPRKRGISSVGNMPPISPAVEGSCALRPQLGLNGISARQSPTTAAAEQEKPRLKDAPSNMSAGGADPSQKSAQKNAAEQASLKVADPNADSCESTRPPSTNAQKKPTSTLSAAGNNKSIFSAKAGPVNSPSKHFATVQPANPTASAKGSEGSNKGVLEPFEAMGSFKVAQLKEQCKLRGLRFGGNRTELLERIRERDCATLAACVCAPVEASTESSVGQSVGSP